MSEYSQQETSELAALARGLRENAAAASYRRLVLVAGAADWTVAVAKTALRAAFTPHHFRLWVGDSAPADATYCAPDELARHLGTETDALVIDTRYGLDPDGLGVGMGTVRAGGLIFLLTPPLADWPTAPDPQAERLAVDGWEATDLGHRFMARLARVLTADRATVIIEQHRPLPQFVPLTPEAPPIASDDPDCATADQAEAVAVVLRTATGHRRRPTVLIADRGRGKSAALGIAAARFLRERGGDIVITGPHRAAVDSVLHHAAVGLGASAKQGRIEIESGSIRFMLPETLLTLETPPALVLVDEAAALPTATLATLLERHSRIVFATTVHGYEGTGGGFRLRFQPILASTTPDWRAVTLNEPIRWRRNDPVEALLFRALLLDAELPAVASAPETIDVRLEVVDRDALADDEPLLRDLFGLLIHAHYRTRPLDLRNLLDGPNLTLYVLRTAAQIVATALVTAEGGFDEPTAQAIWAGKRRPRGHLLPQSLASQVGVIAGARLRAARIMRIAVHPTLQGKGLGTIFVHRLAERARAEGFDVIGANFGATEALLAFWRRTGCVPLRLGVKRDPASGTHSAIVARGLSERGEAVTREAREWMAEDLPVQLADPLRHVDSAIVLALLEGLTMPTPGMRDWQEAAAFACGHRAYEVSVRALRRLSLPALAHTDWREHLDATACTVIAVRVLQQRSWADAAAASGLTGRPAVILTLRAALREVIAAKAPPVILERLAQLGVAP